MLDDRRFTAALAVMSRKQIRSTFECNARINLWHGAVSSGKTIASLLAFLFAVVNAPQNGLIFAVGRTLQTVERNLIDVLMQPYGPFGPFAPYVHHTRGANTATLFGRTVWLVGASDITAEGRIRGATASLIYIDEASLIPEGFFTMCLSRLRVPGAKMLATTNPDGPLHWLKTRFLDREGELNLRQWKFVLDDNPWLPETFKADLKAEHTGLFFRRFILGDWVLAEGAIFEMWDQQRHVVDRLPPIVQWIAAGVDYGTVNPFAAELLGLGADGCLYLTSEYYYSSKVTFRQKTDVEYSQALRDWLADVPIPGSQPLLRGVQPSWIIIDPSAASFRLQLQKDGVLSRLADNEVMAGIRTLASLLHTGRLKVHKSCTGFLEEITGYSWDPKAAERGEDAPIKINDHCLDATRYAVLTTEAVWRNKLRKPDSELVGSP